MAGLAFEFPARKPSGWLQQGGNRGGAAFNAPPPAPLSHSEPFMFLFCCSSFGLMPPEFHSWRIFERNSGIGACTAHSRFHVRLLPFVLWIRQWVQRNCPMGSLLAENCIKCLWA